MRRLLVATVVLVTTTFSYPGWTSLPGKTHDYAFDGGKRRRLRWLGRAYVPKRTAAATGKVALVVFLHGLNKALIKYRWMGGGREGDVRKIVGDLVAAQKIAPVVIAGPSSIVASEVSSGASWNNFDLDNFLDRTITELKGKVAIDESRIVVAGHSGAGCSLFGGLAQVHKSRRKLRAVISIDTCMAGSLAQRLVRKTSADTHLIVSYQTATWRKRSFSLFKSIFNRESAKHPQTKGILRALDHQKPKVAPHDATVKITFHKWLPQIIPATP